MRARLTAALAGMRQAARAARPGRASQTHPARLPSQDTAALELRACRALVEMDDTVRISGQELGFATARFGAQATAPFRAALAAGQAELAAAFAIRQRMDTQWQTEPAGQALLAEILAHCAAARRLLDDQSDAFDRLLGRESASPALLAEVDAYVLQQTPRLADSAAALQRLTAAYPPGAVSAVGTNPAQAADRLDFARARLAEAGRALTDGRRRRAALALQAAEAAADQACDLLNAIPRLESELTQGSSALPAALRELEHDITETAAALGSQPSAAVEAAAAVVAAARADGSAGFDPLARLRLVDHAAAQLDQAAPDARQGRARTDRAAAALDQAMLLARTALTSAEDFVSARRGRIRSTARTRLAEAHRHFEQAITRSPADPEMALREAREADALAAQARWLAERDVAQPELAEPEALMRSGGLAGPAGPPTRRPDWS